MSKKWNLGLKILGITAVGFLVLILAGSTWDYSGKPEFCISCHTMETVTSSHRSSAHAEVSCTACHLGVGFAPTMLFKKATDANQIVKNITGTYEKPIRIRYNVPVIKSCESCHYTKAFRREMLKVTEKFNTDADNTRTKTALLLKVGDGSQLEGIHWHVENSITYGKDDNNNIVSIEVEKTTGEIGSYRSSGGGEPIAFKEMDCVDCHNRVAHRLETPSTITDKYLSEGKLDASLPYLKREAVALLESAKDMEPEAWNKIFEGIVEFYENKHPQVYQKRRDDIEQLPGIMGEMINQILFPNMKVSWETYKDNLGHAGCFQCHNPAFKLDGSESSRELPETIGNDCQMCHNTPVIVQGDNKELIINLQ